MKKILLLVLTLSGLPALSSCVSREYHFIGKLKTWAEAQSYCRERFTDLATVENQGDNTRLLSKLQGSGKPAWVGLYDHLDGWKWSLGDTDFNDEFNNWKIDEPNNHHFNESCVVLSTSGVWLDNACFRTRSSICYNERGDFHLVETKMTWHDAKSFCRAKYRDLVTVRNKSQNDQLTSMLPGFTWIGLHRKTWAKWSDQTPTSFTKWKVNLSLSKDEPTKSCVLVDPTTGLWWDEPCNMKHNFVCQTAYPPARQRKILQLRFRSEANPEDPAVEQQLLEQLQAKLEKHGLSDFKLRWTQTNSQTFHKEKKKGDGTGC